MNVAEYIAILLTFLAISGAFGFWIVQSLVIWYNWMNMTATLLSPDYIWFWLIIAFVFIAFLGVPFWWMAISLSKIAKTFASYLALVIGRIKK